MSGQALATGAISTSTTVSTQAGVLTALHAGTGAAMSAYDGASSTTFLIGIAPALGAVTYHTPVGFTNGLFISVASTTGVGVAHTG